MSEEILKALMQLFALIIKQGSGAQAKEIEFVSNFIKEQLNEEDSAKYLELFNEYAELNSPVGTYDASFTFIDGSNLNMDGQLETGISSYTANSGMSTIIVDVETNALTDMTTTLNLILDGDGVVTGGEFTAQSISTGTMDNQGIVSYSDGTSETLPTPVI